MRKIRRVDLGSPGRTHVPRGTSLPILREKTQIHNEKGKTNEVNVTGWDSNPRRSIKLKLLYSHVSIGNRVGSRSTQHLAFSSVESHHGACAGQKSYHECTVSTTNLAANGEKR